MKKEFDYDKMTSQELEEYIEFVDWSLVPKVAITNEIKTKFYFMKELSLRVWFDELIEKMIIMKDDKVYPDKIFFFLGDRWQMELDLINGDLFVSEGRIWKKINEIKKGLTRSFIKNVMEINFKHLDVIPSYDFDLSEAIFDCHFQQFTKVSDFKVEPFYEKGLSDEDIEQNLRNPGGLKYV